MDSCAIFLKLFKNKSEASFWGDYKILAFEFWTKGEDEDMIIEEDYESHDEE